jgi:superfamily II DNA or RNA helicase
MNLRVWQRECIEQAVSQYKAGQPHFLCLATPGAGKTLMASILAKRLISENLIDLVVCITPSLIVSDDFRFELEKQLGKKLDGKLGSIGRCLTYQSMLLEDDWWSLFNEHRVFVIFDEIHHCSGSDIFNANAWGQKIISDIKGKATFTLALTGTPWRSDNVPIALSHYTGSGLVQCDYRYGLARAITDNVCRTPNITLIDNDRISITESGSIKSFSSFKTLLKESDCSYQSLIESEALIEYMLKQADEKLNILRLSDDRAGGLIVASSVSHAKSIHTVLTNRLGEKASIVTYLETNAVSLIKQFKASNTKWIISVGMISEGTNIPRLKVCCYLTRVKTELYFRQVLGRVLRTNGMNSDKGYFYMPSEPTLAEYAYRVNQDVPSVNIVNRDMKFNTKSKDSKERIKSTQFPPSHTISNYDFSFSNDLEPPNSSSSLSKKYIDSLSINGLFKTFNLNLNIKKAC